MKKANGIMSVLAILLCSDHFLCMSLLMLGVIKWHEGLKTTGMIVFVYMIFHGVYGIGIRGYYSYQHRKRKEREYKKENQSCKLQMLTGTIILILGIAHVLTISQFVYKTDLMGFIALALFTFFVCMHIVISFPRAMITLGLVKKESHYNVYRMVGLIYCVLLGTITIASSLMYYMKGGIG